MSKTLQVIEPFFTLSVGDILQLSDNGKNYVNVRNDEFTKAGKNGEDFSSSFASTVTFSVAYAKELIKEGYVCEVTAEKVNDKQEFVNVFTEIDTLLDQYTKELESVDTVMKGCPECMKLEKCTVLNNLITLLTHLKSLKK